jgi:predicted NBD/HSP70 family sugar kinase
MRLYNERLLLSLVRRHGSIAKVEMARLTGLSAQTISVIVAHLETEGLLLRQGPQRGKVGQPSVPYVLNPDATLSLGLKIGRRSSDLVLVDFLGTVRKRIHSTHSYPLPTQLLHFLRSSVSTITTGLKSKRRICGLGIATPYELWNWESEVGAPTMAMQAWKGFDTVSEISAISDWPVFLCNDGTAACAAECFFGKLVPLRDFLYVFIGSFVGGGVVLNGSVLQGRSGNAGDIGSMPISRLARGKLGAVQLIEVASLYVLENRLRKNGIDPSGLWRSPDSWPDYGATLTEWIEQAAQALAVLAARAMSVIDFEAIVIDGAFPTEIRRRLTTAATSELARLDQQGLTSARVLEGTIGFDARAIGGAALPQVFEFARDREILFRVGSEK